ncbi:cytochrome P450 [Saccharothrix hoggarensis]|uniref:Cytochrome P450 n=1 Tax=Saccharothrix hoggarensis TaxID=913853 RepID=A0ABW3QR83_9PSEU
MTSAPRHLPLSDFPLLLGGDLRGWEHHGIEDDARRAGPVHVATQPNGVRVHVVTVGPERARALLADPRLSKDAAALRAAMATHMVEAGRSPEVSAIIGESMLNTDPPAHSRLRKLVAGALTRGRVLGLEERITTVVRALLDEMPDDAPVDLVRGFALPVPLTVICDLLGVPEQDRTDLAGWSSAMMTEIPEQQIPASGTMAGYLAELVEAKRAEPDGSLLSALVHDEVDGDRLTPDELLTTSVLLVAAGHETTTAAIGNAAAAMLATGTWATVARQPDLVRAVVQETLRFDPPIRNVPHYLATAPVELDGTTVLPEGAIIMVNVGATNRDTAAFGPDADRFDPTREQGAGALGHTAFGHGIHRCVGSHLAALEIEVALRELVTRWPDARLVGRLDDLPRSPAVVINGFTRIDVLLTPPSA